MSNTNDRQKRSKDFTTILFYSWFKEQPEGIRVLKLLKDYQERSLVERCDNFEMQIENGYGFDELQEIELNLKKIQQIQWRIESLEKVKVEVAKYKQEFPDKAEGFTDANIASKLGY